MVETYEGVVDEALVIRHLGVASGNPRDDLKRILDWDCAVALDPLVSSSAQELINRGRKSLLEDIMKRLDRGETDVRDNIMEQLAKGVDIEEWAEGYLNGIIDIRNAIKEVYKDE